MYTGSSDSWLSPPPVAVGGVGGSGTRLVAELLLRLGYDLGNDLNESFDNLTFTLLLKRLELWPPERHPAEIDKALALFLAAARGQLQAGAVDIDYLASLTATSRPTHPRDWLLERARRLVQSVESPEAASDRWGWKEPNTHIFLDMLNQRIPGLRYIHVVRNGLDMAYSENQHQLFLWGRALLGLNYQPESAEDSFRYWAEAHRRVMALGRDMGPRFLLLNFDQLCIEPDEQLARLCDFLDIDPGHDELDTLRQRIKTPSSIGRHKREPRFATRHDDIATLQDMGFSD
ncbi:sulfotransferase [Parahaliea mediterranea]|uniref:sulfotransferase n=1 Tax=Parahaliea mediterranea TaxID=651086 RepID=UPI000E2FB2C7|nr:sulfotransferase [Parahaliea mediterranea]